MFISSMWDVKEPTHYSKRIGRVSVWAGIGKVMCLAWDLVSRSHITLQFGAKVVKNKKIKIKSLE